ncbi:MAG: DUF3782 domain-containing protein [Nodosilinea sp.]
MATPQPTYDDILRLFQETDRRLKDTERLLKEQSQVADLRMQEADRRMVETDRPMEEADLRFKETQQLLKQQSEETDRQIQQVSRQIGKLGNRLGEFVEWQVRPAAIRLLQERNIEVHELASEVSVQRDGEGLEIDLLAINTTQAVLIEVKSKLSQTDVDEHLERLAKFKRLMPRYQDVSALGAVAAMVIPTDVARYAYRQGLFVMAQSGDNLVFLNDPAFIPKAW